MRCILAGKGHTCDENIFSVCVVHEPTGKKTARMDACEEGLRSLVYYLFPAYRELVKAQLVKAQEEGDDG